MRNYLRGPAALLCLLVCLSSLLTACGTGQGDTGEVLRGRYIEEELDLPVSVGEILALDRMEDGSLWMFGLVALTDPSEGGFQGEYRAWSSRDGGESWQEEHYAWLDPLNEAGYFNDNDYIYDAVFASPDELYLAMNIHPEQGEEIPPEPEDDSDPGEGTGDGAGDGNDGAEDFYESFYSSFESIMLRGDRDELTRLDYSPMGEMEGGGRTTPDNMLYTQGGLLLAYYDYVAYVDPATGDERARFTGEWQTLPRGTMAARANLLAVATPANILLYDRDSGAVAEELAYSSAQYLGSLGADGGMYLTALAFQEDGSAIFYANSGGIYRTLLDGSLTEKLLDGELVSIGMPTYEVHRLFQTGDDSFLVQCREAGYGALRLFRYVFDPDVPSVPGKELRVYSLQDNQTIRYAAGEMQLRDPDVVVSYEVGMGDGSVTAADALRTLSTELLAGDGPDILVLDGMPVESYIAQGALLDLSDLLDERIASGELQAAVADTYRRGGNLYAVPGRFSVPLLHGVDTGSITDFDSLAAWLEGRGGSMRVSADIVMERFGHMLSHRWFREDGSLNEERFGRDLTNLMRLTEEPQEGNTYDADADLSTGAIMLKAGVADLNLGWLRSLEDLNAPFSLIAESGAGELRLFPAGGVLQPGTVLGINAATGERELARRFVELALAEDIQVFDFGDGLPVNTAAMEQQITRTTPYSSSYGFGMENPETGEYELVLLYTEKPDAQTLRGVTDLLPHIAEAAPVNLVVWEMILEETRAYFAGDAAPDDAVASLKQKLDLYLAE